MSKFSIRLQDKGRCRIQHELADEHIVTDLPPEYGGKGRSFSSTDMVCAALGSCILTGIESILEREGHDPSKIEMTVEKQLSQKPKMIGSIEIAIGYPDKLDDRLIKKLSRASAMCPVKRSLSENIHINLQFFTG